MKRVGLLLVLVLIGAAHVRADECIASEQFASADALLFGPDNLTRDRLQDRRDAAHPFDSLFDFPADTTITSMDLELGPTDRGSLEDVVWLELAGFNESCPGRTGALTLVGFTGGGPELRLFRTSLRPEATLEWFDGVNWNRTGAVIPLDRPYRLRTVMVLDSGTMDVYLRDETGAKELALVLGVPFRAFSDPTVRRKFSLGRPTHMKVSLAAWQLWRVGRTELVRVSSPGGEVPYGQADVVVRYAAPVALEGDAVRRASTSGLMTYTLRPAQGLRDDMELTDISGWYPTARVQRQTSFRRSGKWSLGISEGPRPVDRESTLPHGDFDLQLFFLIPRELPANRQVYLVRFKNPETGAEPVGPSVYLDYGAAPGGKSFIICQLNPDLYYAEEVTVEPEKWYGLRLVSQRARNAYVAWFIDEKGVRKPLNEGKSLDFFLGSGIGQAVQWRFFSIVSMRPGVTDWPRIDLALHHRRVTVTIPEKEKKQLPGVSFRGLPVEQTKDVDMSDPGKIMGALGGRGVVIDPKWPGFKVGPDDAEKVKGYAAVLVTGNMYWPWSGIELAYSSSGRTWVYPHWRHCSGGTPTADGEFRRCELAEEKPSPLPKGVYPLQMLVLPDANGACRAEVRWILPAGAYDTPQPIPAELLRGEDVTIDHPGGAYPAAAAVVLDGKGYVAVPYVGLAVYDRNWVRTEYKELWFEKALGSRYYTVTGLTWDPWEECFWVHGTGTYLVKLERDLETVASRTYFPLKTVAMAAGPEDFYFVTDKAEVVRYNKFLSARGKIPVEKMFGGSPLFSAVACVDRFLYLATQKDSPIYPSRVICVDTTTWNPVFNVDLGAKFPEVTSMAADGETMVLFGRTSPEVATFHLPPKHELAPQKTFVYIDDMEITALKVADDIRLLPDPSGGIAGWTPGGVLIPNEKGKGWVLRDYRGKSGYEKSNIAYVGREQSQYGWLKVSTLDPHSEAGMLNVDVRTAESPVLRRVVIFYTRDSRLIREHPELYGKNYTVEEFFAQKAFAPWQATFRWWSYHLEGPVHDVHLKTLRMLPAGKGYHEHVFSLEKDLGIKPGETINGIFLSHWRETPAVTSVTLSPSEWTPPEETSGVATSRPVMMEESQRQLEWLSWEQVPYDRGRGSMTLSVRTADEKHFLDRVSWTPVENRQHVALPLGRHLQWRLEMSTRDPWRPPGVAALVFGLNERVSGTVASAEGADGRWLWILLVVPAAAAVAYFIIGRKTWWERRKSG